MTANGEVNVKQRRSDGKHRDAEGDDAIVNVNTITVQGDFYDIATKAGAFMLFIPCILLQLTQQPRNALPRTQFRTSIKLLHVSAPGCHPQGAL